MVMIFLVVEVVYGVLWFVFDFCDGGEVFCSIIGIFEGIIFDFLFCFWVFGGNCSGLWL